MYDSKTIERERMAEVRSYQSNIKIGVCENES